MRKNFIGCLLSIIAVAASAVDVASWQELKDAIEGGHLNITVTKSFSSPSGENTITIPLNCIVTLNNGVAVTLSYEEKSIFG